MVSNLPAPNEGPAKRNRHLAKNGLVIGIGRVPNRRSWNAEAEFAGRSRLKGALL